MDINARAVIDGNASLLEVGQQLFDMVIAAASGKLTKVEDNSHRKFSICSEEGILP